MAKSVLLTTILIVVSSSVNSERRSFLSYSKNFQKAVPHFWKHDQEELNRNLDKNTRQSRGEMRVGPHPPPLRPNPPASWILGTHQVEKELTQNRVNELKNKLIPNNIAHVRAFNQPNPKPKFQLKNSLENKRHKRDVTQVENDREKREVIINPQIKPEMVMQPHLQPALVQKVENQGVRPKLNFHFYNPSIYYPEVIEALSNSTGPYQDKIIEKRDKRQILLMINQRPLQPLELAKKPRTTPNPFIRDTNIADYDIVKPESYKPEVEVVNSMDTDSYQLREPQSLFQYLKSMIFKIGQKHPDEMIPVSKTKDTNEETHIRVKRRMSKFRRDRKQMTRKKKIGRRKKTKVRRAPIKLKKWYHKRQKKVKKGDGTYRGGRGRIPRQHKRPRHYKPPQNETSDYDYYDDDGNIKEPSGETQEGSDDAAYVSYGTGEYADTAEAQAAHQELEKEYQMQLVRQRKKAEMRRLSNSTIQSSEEEFLSINRYVESEESLSNTTKSEQEDEEEYYDEDDSEDYDSEQEEDSEESDGSGSHGGGGRKINNKNAAKKLNNKVTEKKKTQSRTKQFPKIENAFKSSYKLQNQNSYNKAPDNGTNKKTMNINAETNIDLKTKTNALNNVRLTAQKLNVMSQSAYPGFRNSLQQQKQPLNWISAVEFGIPQNKLFKNLQSMSLKKTPDVNSLTNPVVASSGGKNLQSLQSKKEYSALESTSHDKKLKLTSAVKDKSENDQTLTSKTKDGRKKLTSLGSGNLKSIQSLKRHPLVLTSIARHIPDMEISTAEITDQKITETKRDKTDKVTKDDLKLKKEKPAINHNTVATRNNREENTMNHDRKNIKKMSKNGLKNERLHLQKSKSYEEVSSVSNEKLGTSVSSDEVEPAPDDK